VERPPALLARKITFLIVEDVPPGEQIEEDEEEASPRSPRPLSAVIDHITPLSRGGLDVPSNLQIAHYRCNALKHDGPSPAPEYARAVLRSTLDGTPIPARVWQQRHRFRRDKPIWRARYEVLARECDRGNVAIEPWRLALRYRVWQARRRRARRQRARFEPVR
jgi:HNH endonuclease